MERNLRDLEKGNMSGRYRAEHLPNLMLATISSLASSFLLHLHPLISIFPMVSKGRQLIRLSRTSNLKRDLSQLDSMGSSSLSVLMK